MSDTSFNFGHNARDNADPWGRNSAGPDADQPIQGKRHKGSPEGDSSPVSVQEQDGKILLDKHHPFMHHYHCLCDDCVNVNRIAERVKREFTALAKEVRKVAHLNMSPSAAKILQEKAGDGGSLLHGSDVPKKTTQFDITITGFREAPDGFKSLGILDIKPVFDCSAWALNKTNFKALMNKLGDNTDKWAGRKVRLQVIQVRNPSSGTTGPSLAVAA